MSRPAGVDIAEEAKRSQVGSSRQGTAGAVCYQQDRKEDFCTGSRSCQIRSGRQGTAGSGSHEKAGRGRHCERKSDAVTMALANM
jgi:hypothetical protein